LLKTVPKKKKGENVGGPNKPSTFNMVGRNLFPKTVQGEQSVAGNSQGTPNAAQHCFSGNALSRINRGKRRKRKGGVNLGWGKKKGKEGVPKKDNSINKERKRTGKNGRPLALQKKKKAWGELEN